MDNDRCPTIFLFIVFKSLVNAPGVQCLGSVLGLGRAEDWRFFHVATSVIANFRVKPEAGNCSFYQNAVNFHFCTRHNSEIQSKSLSPISWIWMLQESEGKIVPIHAIKACRRHRSRAPLISNLGTRWGWVFNFVLRPLYCPWKNSGTQQSTST